MPRRFDISDPARRERALAAGVRAAKNGRLVAAPAESGYVILTDAFSTSGVMALRAAKELPAQVALGVLVGHRGGLGGIAAAPPVVSELLAAFWPGYLSLLVNAQPTVNWGIQTDRFAVRMPLHPVLLAIAGQVGPIAASGIPGPDSPAAQQCDVVLDAGPRSGPRGALVDVTGKAVVLARPGEPSAEQLRAVVADLVVPAEGATEADEPGHLGNARP